MSAAEAPQFHTVREVAEMFGVAPATVRTWVANGTLRGVKPGGPTGNLRIAATEVERLANKKYGDTSANSNEH